MNADSLSRRGFLASGSAGLLAATARGVVGSSDRLAVGIVGPGGRGRGLLSAFHSATKEQSAEIVAVCDIWSRNRELGVESVKKATGKTPETFSRLEDMLAMKNLDAVIVTTPDHAHARQLVTILEAKKHVYLEKPFANRLDEANTAIDAARKSDRVITLGTQRRSDPHYLAAADVMQTGALGPISQVAIVQNAWSPYRWRSASLVKAIREKDTDWKTWLAGRPARKFDPNRYVEFRLYRDYSTGIIDQWMTHLIDTVHMLTGAKFPRAVTALGGCYAWKDGRENGDCVQVSLDYPEGFLATYGCNLASEAGRSCRVMGRQGTLEYENAWRVSGEGVKGSKLATKEITPKEGIKGEMGIRHMIDWLACTRKGNRATACTAEHGYQHAIACIMSDLALHSGKRMTFDEKARTIVAG